MRAWVLGREAALLPPGRAARRKLLDAVVDARRGLADESPALAAAERALRRRVAVTLREERHGREALDVLRALDPQEHAEEARCHEGLGQPREASLAWQAAADFDAALRCAREVPDLDRAVALATRTRAAEVPALQWAVALRDLLAARPAEAEQLNDHERSALARALDDALPSRSGARRRRG